MSDKKKIKKEEKLEKAKKLMKELKELELTKEDMEHINAGFEPDIPYNTTDWPMMDKDRKI